MEQKKRNIVFDRLAARVTRASGSRTIILIAFLAVIVWLVTGPIFRFSNAWQLVINTATNVVTFLMVFIIQQTQNKDTMALQLKLNELIAANRNASNRLIDIEDLTSEELLMLKNFYISLSELAEREEGMEIKKTHSIEEAENIHKFKKSIHAEPSNIKA